MDASPTAWVPDRPATWTELGIGVLAAWHLGRKFVAGTPSNLPLIVLGAVTTALAIGPLSTTDAGKRIGAGFRAVSPTIRTAGLIVFVATVYLTIWVVPGFADGLGAFSTGMFLTVVVFLVAYLLTVRRIEGWRAS